ncbi:MAG: methylmalonyl-CoA mutase [Thermoleophilia bacterium]|nr:methylmalonyl-CoA mutase [Thermoleophilia bacterium]
MSDPLAAGFAPVSYEQWSKKAGRDDPDAELSTRLEDGIEAKWLYTCDDELSPDPGGLPGRAPFVRGTRAGRHWQIRQQHGHLDRAVANREILEDLNGGVTEVTLGFDQAARLGIGPGDERFDAARGDGGIAISNLEDLSQVLEGVYLDMAGIALDAGAAALPAAALLAARWRESGIAPDRALGSFRADPLGTLAREGTLPVSPEEALAQAAGMALEVSRGMPGVRALGVDTGIYVEAGAGTAWELGIAIATGVEHLRAALAAGLEPAAAAAQIEFTLAAGPDQFLEMAKFRAVRRLWARVLEQCGVEPGARHSATYGETTARMITAVDPWVNMLRVTTAAFAAGTGGADGVTVTPFDRALGQPSNLGRRIARNTQIVLQDEASLGRIADPVAGSWYGEALTDEVARSGWERFTEIEKEGGALAALRSGLIADALAGEADHRREELIHRTRVMTGVNEFPLLGDDGTQVTEVDREALARIDRARLAERPEPGDIGEIAAIALGGQLEKGTSLAVAGARIDELTAALAAGASGGPASIRPLEPRPDAAPFEHLRDTVTAWEAAGNDRPQIYLACMGTIAAHVNLANWAKSFFEVAGIETVPSGYLEGAAEQAEVFKAGGFRLAAVCAGRSETPEGVAGLVESLRAAGAEYIYMVNSTPELNQAAGADELVKNGVNMVEVLTAALGRLGVEVAGGPVGAGR